MTTLIDDIESIEDDIDDTYIDGDYDGGIDGDYNGGIDGDYDGNVG